VKTEKRGEFPTLLKRLSDNDITLTVPGKSTKVEFQGEKESRTLTPSEYRQYRQIYGRNLKRRLSGQNSILMRLTGEKLEDMVEDIVTDVREESKNELVRSAR
jgi:hypothetical protein